MSGFLSRQRLLRLFPPSLPVVYVLLLAWLLIGPLWAQPGLPNSADGLLHLQRSAAVARSWQAGVFWPRWFPDVYQGLGAPVFHYYSSLFYQLAGSLHLLGLPLDLAAKLLITAFFAVSGLAVWAWLRRLLGPRAGLAGAALYLAQPRLFREIYFQGDYPQLLALLWLPVVFWAFTRLVLDGRRRDWLFAPLSLAALALTHHITTLLGAALLALYWPILLLWRRRRAGWWRGPVGALLAAGLSAFFWLPALGDAGLVRIGNVGDPFFHFGRWFVPWRDLLAAPPLFDSRAANPPFPEMLGWAAWLAVAVGALVVARSLVRRTGWTASRVWAVTGLLMLALCLALTQAWSAPLWETLPGLPLLQFPSRWLGAAGLGATLVAGAAVAAWAERRSLLAALALILAVGLASSVFLFPHQPFQRAESYSAADTRAFERRSQAWGTTAGDEFLPAWAAEPAPHAGQQAEAAHLPAGATWTWQTPHRAALYPADGGELPSGPLVLPVHYFPAWEVTEDSAPLSLSPSAEGLAAVTLPGSVHQLSLRWPGTVWQQRGEWASRLALLAWLGAVVWAGRRRGREATPAEDGALADWRAPLAAAGLALALILGFGAVRALDLGWFQRASAPGEASPAGHPVRVELGGGEQPGVTLLGWELLSSPARPGSELRLRLYWQAGSRLRQSLHSFLQLYLPEQRRGLAGVQNENPGRISTANWRPDLYYVDDLALPLPADLPPVAYTLAVGLVDDTGQRLAVADNPDDLVLLDAVEVEPLQAGATQPLQPEVAAAATFGPALRLQGYDLLADPGGPILRLYWEVVGTPSSDLATSVQLLDEQGSPVAQFGGPPLEGLLPTGHWPAGALLIDRRKLWLPEGLASGDYRFRVGLTEVETGRRLVPIPERGAEAHFEGESLVVPLYVPP